jgi:hypothetical protein
MANLKGTRAENVVRPPMGDRALGKTVSVRFDPSIEESLRSMGAKMQKFIRDAVAEKLEREAKS